jgi:hypothetical protein
MEDDYEQYAIQGTTTTGINGHNNVQEADASNDSDNNNSGTTFTSQKNYFEEYNTK